MIRRALLWLAAAVPLALGFCVAVVVVSALFVWAAFVEGYSRGMRR
jgi:hypothetical protein